MQTYDRQMLDYLQQVVEVRERSSAVAEMAKRHRNADQAAFHDGYMFVPVEGASGFKIVKSIDRFAQ
ncbi:MAG: hypothetical protein Q4D06_06430 [Coriobacteriia bacterium]|nr:hypothetical protein [Coriobacteriia bacterium]